MSDNAPIVKFRTRFHGISVAQIKKVSVTRETAVCVWIDTRRYAKRSELENFFDTWDEARAFLLNCAEARLMDARRRLQEARDALGNVKGMKQPKEST